jgi:hypothetical protein
MFAVGVFRIHTYYVEGKLQGKESKIGRVSEKVQLEHAQMYVSELHSESA